MIAEIRAHIKEAIELCNSRYFEIDEPFFSEEDLIETKADYSFHVEIGTTTPTIGSIDGNVNQVSATLVTYRQGTRDKLADFDEGYTQAMIIRDIILDISLLNSKNYLKGVVSTDIVPGEVIDSQNIYTYTTNFIFTISYGLGE